MRRWIRSSVMGLLGGLLLGGLAGCQNGDGGSAGGSPQPATSGANQTSKAGSTAGQAGSTAGQTGDRGVTAPARSIDAKQLSETVKEEVKGGEASEGPSPFAYLWSPSKAELIKDEPLAVTVPAGLQPLTPKIYVPSANPITKGKYELGRQLYFDPRVSLDSTVSCATCHNPARGWTDGMAVSIGIGGQAGVAALHRSSTLRMARRCSGTDALLHWRARRRGRFRTRSRWAIRSTRQSSSACENPVVLGTV